MAADAGGGPNAGGPGRLLSRREAGDRIGGAGTGDLRLRHHGERRLPLYRVATLPHAAAGVLLRIGVGISGGGHRWNGELLGHANEHYRNTNVSRRKLALKI